MKVTRKAFLGKGIAIGSLLLLIVLLCILKTNAAVSEWWTRTIARAVIWFGGNVFGVLPFSMFELSIVLVILGVIAWLVYSIILLTSRNYPRMLSLFMTVIIIVLSFVNVYLASASFGYNRQPAELDYYKVSDQGVLDYSVVRKSVYDFIDDLNALSESMQRDENGDVVSPYSVQELNELLVEEYKRLNGDYYGWYTPKAKGIINKTIMSELHILGVFFAPYGEPNYNPNTHILGLPLTIAHEMAHSKGLMIENEADVLARYICLTSKDDFLRYCAYLDCYSNFLDILNYYQEESMAYYNANDSISSLVKSDKSKIARQLSEFTALSNLGNWLNDIYLKLNGRDGVNDYIDKGNIEVPPEVIIPPGAPVEPAPIIINSYSITQGILLNIYMQSEDI